MKVAILAFGTRGDVQPFVAFGLGLRDAGHDVKLITPANFFDFVTAYGLKCAPITVDVRQSENKNVKTGRLSPYAIYRLAQLYVRQALVKIWEASEDAEVIILSDWGRIPGIHIAEKLNVPTIMGLTHPQQMRFLYPETHVFGSKWQLFSSRLRKRAYWHLILKQLINEWRRKTLKLPRTTFGGSEGQLKRRKTPLFFAHSPAVFPKPSSWPDEFHITGYWFLERLADWQPPVALADFLADGPPPIYVGFSSMSNRKITKMASLIFEALSKTKQRAILGAGWSKMGQSATLPENVIVVDAVPHDWLFPQVAAVVHHGGAGTTAAVFHAGVPNIIIPFDLDQPFWAWRVNQLRAGLFTIPSTKLTAERLAEAIEATVNDEDIKSCAATLGEYIRTEDGVTNAVDLFHQYVAHS